MKRFIHLITILLLALCSRAQTYNVDTYDVEEGLVINTVIAVYQDDKGFIWAGTNGGGISIYDGSKFSSITEQDGLASNVVFGIDQDDNGDYYIATKEGLTVISGGKFKNYDKTNGLSNNLLFSVLCSKKHGIILGSYDGIFEFKNDTIVPISNEILAKESAYVIYEGSNENIWFGTRKTGAYEFNGDIVTHIDAETLKYPFVFTIVEDDDKNVWVGTGTGFNKVSPDRKSVLYIKPHENTLRVTAQSSSKSKDGTLWFGTQSGLYRYKDGVFHHYTDDNGLPISHIYEVTVDREGNVWLGTNGKGLAKIRENLEVFTNYSTKDGLANDIVHTIFEDSKGYIWIGSEHSVARINLENKVDVFHKVELSPGKFNGYAERTYDIKEDKEGNVWFATFNSAHSIVKYNGKEFISYHEGGDLSENQFFTMLIEDTVFYLGGRKGLFKFYNGDLEQYLPEEIKEEVWSITKVKKGKLWVGTDKGALILDGSSVEYFNETHGFVKGRVRKILEDKDGFLWFATEEGLYRYDFKKFDRITTKDGLSADNIYSLLIDKNDMLWVGTAKGIQKVNINKYNKTGEIEIEKYAKQEGFIGVECNMNAAFEDSKGKLWFGTVKGVTVLNPSLEIKNKLEPQTHITNVRLEFEKFNYLQYSDSIDKQSELPINLVLPYAKNHLSFDFIANSFVITSKVRYQYMLEGLDKKWLPITNKTEAVYPHIPEGTYTFKVKAMNNDGVWNEEPQTFKFTILAPWYRTWWAILIYIVIVVSGFLAYTKYRTAALQRQKQILEEQVVERTAEVVKEKEKVEAINKQVLLQNEVIEEKNKEITDSINYAKGIQDAILPHEDKVKKHLPNSFILFRPKDIVSGDFYWMEEKDDVVYFTAADCTGHGVPGAFVSMVGVNGLNRSVNGFALRKPSDMLNKLRDLVEETFRKRKDGMDIGLCAVNFKTKTLEYAGANNPLWVIRKKGLPPLIVNNEEIETKIGDDFCDLYEVKADKQPVGAFEAATPFTNNEIKLEEGDALYVFSDGYPDQFGGPKGKKFMSKSMKKLLIDLYNKSMDEQKEVLNKSIEEWMEEGNVEQIDDICVFGVKI